MNKQELIAMNEKKEQPLKLTAASLKEIRLMYQAGAINKKQLAEILNLSPLTNEPEVPPMPKAQAEAFLKELREKIGGPVESKA